LIGEAAFRVQGIDCAAFGRIFGAQVGLLYCSSRIRRSNRWRSDSDQADVDGNCTVNIDDLLIVINTWGSCPGSIWP
jgi:hypothetical protein